MSQIVVIGEVMLELSGPRFDEKILSFAGDTANTAIYLARLGQTTAYLTALGQDPYSTRIMAGLAGEGVNTDLIMRHATRLPGLYAIETDASGERSFYYWREQSAARELFRMPNVDEALVQANRADVLYLSGITLSIFDQADRDALADIARQVRERGGQVVFDPNYRPAGWQSVSEAQDAIANIAPWVSMALPTLDDENVLYGDNSIEDHAQRWRSWGVDEIILKDGKNGCHLVFNESAPIAVLTPMPIKAVDTTGAGDSFNAAYLAARLRGKMPAEAARAGHQLAACVIEHYGAIIPLSVMPPQ